MIIVNLFSFGKFTTIYLKGKDKNIKLFIRLLNR